jgi:hypothetical protein
MLLIHELAHAFRIIVTIDCSPERLVEGTVPFPREPLNLGLRCEREQGRNTEHQLHGHMFSRT